MSIRYDYFPLPDETPLTIETTDQVASSVSSGLESSVDDSPYRLKRYNRRTKLTSVYAELRSLRIDGYTHVANMPGNFREILYYARHFRLIVLDHRVNKLIADSVVDYLTE